MLYIYICEDEEVQLNYIREMITEYIADQRIDARIVAARQDPEEIMAELHDYCQPAIFFIDIQLDGYDMDGFDLARRLKWLNSEYAVVFLTSSTDFAYKVFEYDLEVLDYVVKEPEYFRQKRINNSLIRRLDRIFEKMMSLCDKKNKATIALAGGGKVTNVIMEDIIYIQSVAGRHQAEVYLDNRVIIVRQSMKSIYELLSEDFVYVNKSCIVNRYKMQELDKKERFLYLAGGFRVEVAYRELNDIAKIMERNGLKRQ
ncbi:MAG: response regulator transcription factor [Dorea sp.]|jgi:Response regulator of the LytR/AlgR family|nr:response regulator transcription factor [Dorea sp.]